MFIFLLRLCLISQSFHRYILQFHEETREEIDKRKELARHALATLPETALEVDTETPYPAELGFPKRPPWDSSMGRQTLEAREQRYFRVTFMTTHHNNIFIF
jgi:hypothetical protein